MPTTRRLFGIIDDATAGGTTYDVLAAAPVGGTVNVAKTTGEPPDASIFYPVTSADFEPGIETIDRNDEVRGRRAVTAPRPFRGAPQMTFSAGAYRSLIEKVARKTLGGTDTPTGTAPASITHNLSILGFGSTALPAVHAQMVRDDLNHKMSGGSFESMNLAFPLDGEGTIECTLMGLFAENFATAAPTATYTGFSEDVMMLRDAQVFIDGSGTSVTDLQGFNFGWTNNLNRKWFAKRNVVTRTLGTPAKTYKLWYPQENKLGAAQDATYSIQFGNPSSAQELARDYAQVQKFVFEVVGGPLGTTPAASELLRITIYGGVHTGGGAEGLNAREDITASFDGGAFYSEADSLDVKFEIVNATATAIT
jgi:hypothetical protein